MFLKVLLFAGIGTILFIILLVILVLVFIPGSPVNAPTPPPNQSNVKYPDPVIVEDDPIEDPLEDPLNDPNYLGMIDPIVANQLHYRFADNMYTSTKGGYKFKYNMNNNFIFPNTKLAHDGKYSVTSEKDCAYDAIGYHDKSKPQHYHYMYYPNKPANERCYLGTDGPYPNGVLLNNDPNNIKSGYYVGSS